MPLLKDKMMEDRIIEDAYGWKCRLIYTKGCAHCDKCDFNWTEDIMHCPNHLCRHYDSDTDSRIGGYLKKIEKVQYNEDTDR